MISVTGFQIPGYTGNGGSEPEVVNAVEASGTEPKNYVIPTVFWMIAFLVIGYVGLAYLVEGE